MQVLGEEFSMMTFMFIAVVGTFLQQSGDAARTHEEMMQVSVTPTHFRKDPVEAHTSPESALTELQSAAQEQTNLPSYTHP